MRRLGVIIGRFQVAKLHTGHEGLLRKADMSSDRLLVLIGRSLTGQPTAKNPLPFDSVKKLILDELPRAQVLSLPDVPGDDLKWSNQVDMCISLVAPDAEEVVLFGGRDSFIPYYKGVYPTQEFTEIKCDDSGTDSREVIKRLPPMTCSGREGAIWSVMNKYPVCYPCVDIGVVNQRGASKILLGRKKDECLWRLPGGFVDPGETFEQAARRELREETLLHTGDAKYLGSYVIDDGRYRGGPDNITTSLWLAKVSCDEEKAIASDDLEEVRWWSCKSLGQMTPIEVDAFINPSHKQLIRRILKEVV